MKDEQPDLFRREDYLKKDAKADYLFSKSYNDMSCEISRVANEEITIWTRIVSWIYSVIHRDPRKFKKFQNTEEKFKSARAFNKMSDSLKTVPDHTMDNHQIMEHTKREIKP
ncbi:MAG: hypothetical protein H7A25_10050 [Leptospiraceae bacterium]|nr:hypothetical protein [Leptospiraceae bacterium]MCP5500233.1 hypothetical protein [Leptospiraceae bacterium]